MNKCVTKLNDLIELFPNRTVFGVIKDLVDMSPYDDVPDGMFERVIEESIGEFLRIKNDKAKGISFFDRIAT